LFLFFVFCFLFFSFFFFLLFFPSFFGVGFHRKKAEHQRARTEKKKKKEEKKGRRSKRDVESEKGGRGLRGTHWEKARVKKRERRSPHPKKGMAVFSIFER
jgi:hypothetical protein